MYFGKTIKLFRTSKNLTQVEVASSLEISPEYLSKLENDARRPSLVLLSKLSTVLEIPLQLLIFTSLQPDDFPKSKRKAFKNSKPVLDKLLQLILLEDNTDFNAVTDLLTQLKEIRNNHRPNLKSA